MNKPINIFKNRLVTKGADMEKKKVVSKKKEIVTKDVTICPSTAQMIEKAKLDGVETAFDRADWPRK